MKYLNLNDCAIDNVVGKIVVVQNIEYIISSLLSYGKTKYVFKAINIKSNICSHVIKIYRDQNDKRKLYNELISSRLCHDMDILQPNVIVPSDSEREKYHSNCLFHLEELYTFNRESEDARLAEARQLFNQQNFTNSKMIFDALLYDNCYDTEAILGKYLCEKKLHLNYDISSLRTIITIEPHSRYYYEFILLEMLKEAQVDMYEDISNSLKVDISNSIVNFLNGLYEENYDYEDAYQKLYKQFYISLIATPLNDIVGDVPMAYCNVLLSFSDNNDYYGLVNFDNSDTFENREDEEEFHKAVELFNNDNKNIKSFEIIYDIIKRNPNQRDYTQAFLGIAFIFKRFSEYISIYKDMNRNFSTEQYDFMAIQSYLHIGLPEKAIEITKRVKTPKELRDISIEELNKKNDSEKLSEKAFEEFKKSNVKDALSLSKQAFDLYPFGIENCINSLIYAIDNNTSFNMVKQILQFTVQDYTYFILHNCIYKILNNNFDKGLIYRISELHDILLKLINDKDGLEIDNIPSKALFYSRKGIIEAPLVKTYEILLYGYKEAKKKCLQELVKFETVVTLYEECSQFQSKEMPEI